MKRIVPDCSFCGNLFLREEKTDTAVGYLSEIKNEENLFIVPPLWWFEISNLFTSSVRRKRMKPAEALSALQLLKELSPVTIPGSGFDYAEKLLEIASLYGLSAYDSAYLELAMRENAVLATFDEELAKAAKKAGVETVVS